MSALALRGPYWVTIRQHRRSLWVALALAALAVATLITSRLWSDSATEALRAAGCTYGDDRSCYDPVLVYTADQWFARHLVEYTALGMLVLPGLLGAFLAGPLIARELESGTYRLAWTQSVSPARWLAAKLAVPAALVVTVVPLLGLVFHWSWSTGPARDFPTYWYEPTMFASYGTVPVTNALLGLALGTAVGLLVRRTVLAMGVAALVTGVAVAALAWLRPGLWPADTLTGRELSLRVSDAWVLSNGMITSSGERVGWEYCSISAETERACMIGRGGVTDYADFHPSSHFWPLQLVESGIALALATLVLLVTFRVLRTRHP
ncbi:hypothetical protein ABT154_26525 [Streptomyces sp. NPDC001728]|uniref:ABC transporter permease n=1 Tax=Streptomyces sp. NPDC001728 TaxID=3154396 RepID=UPI00331BBE57